MGRLFSSGSSVLLIGGRFFVNISVGSVESSDIKIVIEEGHPAIQFINMVPELTDHQVYDYIVPILEEYGLASLSPQIWLMEPMSGLSEADAKH